MAESGVVDVGSCQGADVGAKCGTGWEMENRKKETMHEVDAVR